MIRTIFQSLLLFLVLVASVEGTIDRASAGHPHGADETHELADLDAHDHAQTGDSDDQTTESHCEHCCHGHTSGISTTISANTLDQTRSCAGIVYDDRIKLLAIAPPTPPPTA
jgi:hypothetical protein